MHETAIFCINDVTRPRFFERSGGGMTGQISTMFPTVQCLQRHSENELENTKYNPTTPNYTVKGVVMILYRE